MLHIIQLSAADGKLEEKVKGVPQPSTRSTTTGSHNQTLAHNERSLNDSTPETTNPGAPGFVIGKDYITSLLRLNRVPTFLEFFQQLLHFIQRTRRIVQRHACQLAGHVVVEAIQVLGDLTAQILVQRSL